MLKVFNGIGSTGGEQNAIVLGTSIEELDLQSLDTINRIASNSSNPSKIAMNCPTLKRVYMPKMTSFWTQMNSNAQAGAHFHNCPNIEVIQVGKLTSFNSINMTQYGLDSPMLNLIDFEIGTGTAINLDFTYWNPTNVLSDADKTATFLQNFRDHIALRLTASGSGKTLTLSQAVRDAIHAAEATYGIEAIIVTQKGWTLSPAPTA